MKRLISITTVVVLCSALFFVVVDASANEQSSKGTWSGTNNVSPSTGACLEAGGIAESEASGVGIVSHWGAVTWVGDKMCVFLLLPTGVYPEYFPVSQGSGAGTITTASGDEIYLEMVFTLIGNPNPITFGGHDKGTWTQDVTMVGGTGRFTNLTGHAYGSGVWTNNNDGTLSWEGTSIGAFEY